MIIAAGISNEYEGEGEDRSFTLPEFQDELIKNVSAANPRTVVVFHGGGNFDSLSPMRVVRVGTRNTPLSCIIRSASSSDGRGIRSS